MVAVDELEGKGQSVVTNVSSTTREQLEERIRQLEAEAQRNASSQNSQRYRNGKDGRKSSGKFRNADKSPSDSESPKDTRTKFVKFCYKCGEDSHMLPQCSNDTNAALVQKKLCERHQNRQAQRQSAPSQSSPPLNN